MKRMRLKDKVVEIEEPAKETEESKKTEDKNRKRTL